MLAYVMQIPRSVLSIALLAVFPFACSSTDEAAPSPADSGVADTTSPDASLPVPDASSTDGSTPTDSGPSEVVVQTDLKLAGFVHPIDVYAPPGATRVVVYLHGGGGSKEQGAEQLGLRTETKGTVTYDKAWLLANRVAFVIPQGQAANGQLGTTWSNYLMTSGVDDMAFLTALAAAIRSGTLSTALPALSKVAVSGHSNGGIMANRVWCEGPTLFDAFVSFAGPASVHLAAGADHACAPSVTKPYLGYVGDQDVVLQTAGNTDVATWTIVPALANTDGFLDPNVVNEAFFHRDLRVPATCGGVAAAPTVSGKLTKFSDCAGKIQLVRVTGADHCLSGIVCTHVFGGTQGPSMERVVGRRMIDVLTEFFVAKVP
jgi:poly(3-hydroxybutyrate) depolymerase